MQPTQLRSEKPDMLFHVSRCCSGSSVGGRPFGVPPASQQGDDDDDCGSGGGHAVEVQRTDEDDTRRSSGEETTERRRRRRDHGGPAAASQQQRKHRDYSVDELLRNDVRPSSYDDSQTDSHGPSSESHHDEAETTNSAFQHISWNVEPVALPPPPPLSLYTTPYRPHWTDWMMMSDDGCRRRGRAQFDGDVLRRPFLAPLFDPPPPPVNFLSTLQRGTVERHQLPWSTLRQDFSVPVPRRSRT